MAEVVDTVDIKIDSDEQINRALQSYAGSIREPWQLILEYVQNSLDNALELRRENDNKIPYPVKVKIDVDNNDVRILDNCKGMSVDVLKELAEKVFSSKKHGVPGTLKRSGFGVHMFRSYYKEMTIKTKMKGGPVLEMTLKRGEEFIRGNKILKTDGFPYESGTLVVLSGFDPTRFESSGIDPKRLKEEVKIRFSNALTHPNLDIQVLKDGIPV